MQSEDEAVRVAAYRARQAAWQVHEEAVAGVLNALAGWRLETYRRRSGRHGAGPMHFLEEPLIQARTSLATLDAMMAAVAEIRPAAQKALATQARLLGKERLGPWDLFAPCPAAGDKRWSYAEAIDLVAHAYGAVDPEMGAFIRMMDANRWIEARVGPNKRPGAYCTGFPKSRSPRVYMTYTGHEIRTLAHELGHALHNWVMRDMPLVLTFYPMTLAETASVFGETLVDAALLERATTPEDRLQVGWTTARAVEAFCLNIPARYEFERRLYERRATQTLTPGELKALMSESMRTWYGDALSEPDEMFWASKLHFSMASVSFYNFPYTFGYLFALGVYAQRERFGAGFYKAYVDLLRDTGRMTVEEVAAKHLGVDLTRPDFWRQSLGIARAALDAFDTAAKATVS
jgi:oligoendopeptidase F